jgi:4-amino-4-deoxy-L-arabinose transferase-like glycosyltransferase
MQEAQRLDDRRALPFVLTSVPVLTAAVAVGVVLRFATLAVQSFDSDELFTVWLVRMPFGEMLRTIPHSESTPPLYYVLAWPWSHVFGSWEAGLRSVSALFGSLTIVVAYAAARRLAGRRAALVTAWLVAVNPLLVWYSQEARAYALLVLLATASIVTVLDAAERPAPRSLAWWAVVAALAIATFYFALFVVVPEALWLLWRTRRRAALVACALPAATSVAVLPILIEQRRAGNQEHVSGSSLLHRVVGIPKDFVVGFSIPHELAVSALGLLLALAGVVLLVVRATPRERRGGVLALVFGVPTVVLPVLLALGIWDVVAPRYTIAAVVPCAIAVAIGFATGRAGLVAAAALCVLSLYAVVAVDSDRRYQREDWQRGGEALGVPRVERIVLVTPETRPHLWAYTDPVAPLPASGARVREIDVVGLNVLGYESSGAPVPPRPVPAPRAPSGFRLVERRYASTYTLLRYRASAPVQVGPEQLAALRLTPTLPDSAFVQQPRR